MRSISKQAIAIALLAVAVFAVPGGNAAIAAKSSCNSVKKTYPFGIALNKQSIGTSRAEINRAKYIQLMYLDQDLDGIICEIEKLQTKVASPFASLVTSPATTAPRTVVTLPPRTDVTLSPRTAVTLSPRTVVTLSPRPIFTMPTTTINPECPGLTSYECAIKLSGRSRIVIPTTTIDPVCIGLNFLECWRYQRGLVPNPFRATPTTTAFPPTVTTSFPPTTTTTLPPTTTSSICIPDSYEVSRLNYAIQPWNNNYSRTRALFIYSGRIDAVRMLESYTQAMRDRYDSAMTLINSCVRTYWEITDWNSISWPNH